MFRHTGYASLPLHTGRAPVWLFGRMVRLSREILIYLASEFDDLGFFAAGGKRAHVP